MGPLLNQPPYLSLPFYPSLSLVSISIATSSDTCNSIPVCHTINIRLFFPFSPPPLSLYLSRGRDPYLLSTLRVASSSKRSTPSSPCESEEGSGSDSDSNDDNTGSDDGAAAETAGAEAKTPATSGSKGKNGLKKRESKHATTETKIDERLRLALLAVESRAVGFIRSGRDFTISSGAVSGYRYQKIDITDRIGEKTSILERGYVMQTRDSARGGGGRRRGRKKESHQTKHQKRKIARYTRALSSGVLATPHNCT